jgi:L-2-hydroxycarboxylate dehydrogenase (NAD+)
VRFEYALHQAEAGAGRTAPELVLDRGHLAVVSGHNGFGYLAGHFATRLLIERAREHAIAAVALKAARHTGMLGYYVDMAARAGVVAMAFGHCCPLMAPAGGSRRLLGTNPVAFGFPAEPDPIVVDMATSAISYGDVLERQRAGELLPADCALDSEGNPTRDPAAALEGALLPFGGHRGGALAVAIQLLAGALAGAAPVPPAGQDYGLLLVGFSRGAFAGADSYDAAVRAFTEAYLSVPPLPGQEVRLPGARRYRNWRERSAGCIAISDKLAVILGLSG